MANKDLLNEAIETSGMKKGFIADALKMSRPTFYSRLENPGNFTGEQIMLLCELLRLGAEQRNKIFFA